jgi:hypothetical protein
VSTLPLLSATWSPVRIGGWTYAKCPRCRRLLASFSHRPNPGSSEWIDTGFELAFDARRDPTTGEYKAGGAATPPREAVAQESVNTGVLNLSMRASGDEWDRELPRNRAVVVVCPGKPGDSKGIAGHKAQPCGRRVRITPPSS